MRLGEVGWLAAGRSVCMAAGFTPDIVKAADSLPPHAGRQKDGACHRQGG